MSSQRKGKSVVILRQNFIVGYVEKVIVFNAAFNSCTLATPTGNGRVSVRHHLLKEVISCHATVCAQHKIITFQKVMVVMVVLALHVVLLEGAMT